MERYIARGNRGTIETMRAMLDVATEGAPGIPPTRKFVMRSFDAALRSNWNYVPDGDMETIRTIERMFFDFRTTGHFQGDCDDAAVLACALVLIEPKARPGIRRMEWLRTANLVAARPPEEMDFKHVFVEAVDGNGAFLIDPTAPVDADYTDFELFRMPISWRT